MSDVRNIMCAKCRVPIEGPAESRDNDVVACPMCGNTDTVANVTREVADYVEHCLAERLSNSFERIARNSSVMTFKKGTRVQRSFKFVVDMPELT